MRCWCGYLSGGQTEQGLTTHTHPFNVPLSATTRVSQYQKGKTHLDFTEARDSEWQWHQLGHMQVCTALQTDNHASTPPLKFFTGRMPFLPTNQLRQSTEGIKQGLMTPPHTRLTAHFRDYSGKPVQRHTMCVNNLPKVVS